MSTKIYEAWAVRHRYPKSKDKFFVGRYWFHRELTPSLAGHMTCAFETREEARKALRKDEDPYGTNEVVRVTVTITESRKK